MTGWENSPEQHEPGAHGSTLDGWADQEPEEIQAHFEFSGYDDWEIERWQEQWEKEEEEEEEESFGLGNLVEPWEANEWLPMPTIDSNSLLVLWVELHGRVALRFHSVFRERPEIRELVYYPWEILEEAFATSPKLKEILSRARELDPEVQRKLNSAKPPSAEKREEILPLPGDPGATRRPGGKREHYRTGEEAELRHIARQHKWWV